MFRRYAEVIVPLSLPQLFTYAIPETFFSSCKRGSRVVVPFGKNKLYSAVVYSVKDDIDSESQKFEIKEILEVLDDKPVFNDLQLKFWDWIASYYMCSLGEVYRTAVPSVLKLESETVLYRTTKPLDINEVNLTERSLLEAFNSAQGGIKLSAVSKYTGKKNNISLVKKLVFLSYIVADKIIEEKFKPKTVKFVSVSEGFEPSELDILLKKAPKQFEIMLYVAKNGRVNRKDIAEKYSVSALSSLVQKGLLLETECEVSRLKNYDGELKSTCQLTENQQIAYDNILNFFQEKNAVLLFGVTGSGKTELYISLIQEYLNKGKQVLYLLPEIVLTSQIIRRLQRVFGSQVGIYHSKISDYERSEIWQNLIDKDNPLSYKLIVGVRSSIFLPFSDLGLVIVDEEHETTYKQFDSQPKYNARDCALVLALLHGAKTLLGSATPSFESYYNATTGKYGLAELHSRFSETQMPEIELVNTLQAQRKGLMKSLFSQQLLTRIGESLEQKKQIVLYRNRRGFSPYVECSACGWIPVCENCDVTLTYHKRENRLVCHHCGYAIDMPHTCFACGGSSMATKGFGTEKVEDEIQIFFPDAKISRLDADVMTSKARFEQVIYDFENGETDILTGTQVISKGFDFDNLMLCGILDADNMLYFPDFRAEERTFQQLTQVSGRVGRRGERGKVLIQTSNPENEVFKDVVHGDYKGMYKRLIAERSRFAYPPFTRLIKIEIKHREEAQVNYSGAMLAGILSKTFGAGVLGPEFPLVPRIQNLFIKEIMLKISRKNYGAAAKKIILDAINYTKSMALKSGLVISINVDPY
ncbi:MAG: primosomal protein N' [Bacteroidales bacterium]|nr:primosomal protein N' [Bacteroidales bacterium]